MSEIVIECNPKSVSSSELEAIFWETSSRSTFSSDREKSEFQFKYLDLYLEHYRDYLCIARLSHSLKVVGYCLGAPETDLPHFYDAQPHLKVFKDLFLQYPAHLHINFSSSFRGQGLGSKLLIAFEENLASKKIEGLHIMTSSNARNVNFYKKMGFHFTVERQWMKGEILFMGKDLKS